MSMEAGLFPTPRESRPTGLVARVVVERGIDRADFGVDGLSYLVPEGLKDLGIGERVEVPLGRGDRVSHGVVVEVGPPTGGEPARLKAISKRKGGRVPPGLVELARWMGRYYCCPLGMVLAAMLPAAVKKETGRTVRILVDRPNLPDSSIPLTPAAITLTKGVRAAWAQIEALESGIFPLTAKELAQRVGLKTVGPVNRLVEAGLLVEVKRAVVRAGWRQWEQNAPRDRDLVAPRLTSAQQKAVDGVIGTLGAFAAHLLLGVTGSGKTEVYLRVLEAVIKRGGSAIVLVPEISLTPQTAGRFIARFREAGVAVLHSGLTAAQRHQEWTRAASGEARIVVGARSAVFAPFGMASIDAAHKLGVIIVDEEHDSSYKQDQLPRYNARDVALRRAQLEGCPVVLGSATPSLESWHNAVNGKFRLVELPERVGGGALPKVEVVDLAEEARSRVDDPRRIHALGPRLEHAIGRTLDTGGQVILLLNRRGYANYVHCPDQRCGWLMTCEMCDVTMVFHAGGHQGIKASRHQAGGMPLCRCHHCLAEQKLPANCPVCGKRVNTFGIGTQRLEEEISRKFPRLVLGENMLRLDADTMHRASDYFQALERFERGEVKLLLGTQMIAKGLDFPNVRLVGVVNADTAMHLPDFRASERTFQLVAQVAGRAGRSGRAIGEGQDRVIVQTFNPREPAITFAAGHDYRGFAERELACREAAGLPPAGRMARIVCRDEDPGKAEASGRVIARALYDAAAAGAAGGAGLRVRGPIACPISRIGGFFRVAVEVLGPSASAVQAALTSARNAGVLKSDDRTAVDVDPVSLL